MVIRGANDRTTEGGGSSRNGLGSEGWVGRGACGCASRVETASLSLLIARHESVVEARGVSVVWGRGWASDATHPRVAGGGSGAGCSRGGPELGRAAGGEGPSAVGAAGGGERLECVFDAVGGEVALAVVADLGAGQSRG